MENFREYRTVDKSTWGDGAWNGEPDKRQWQDGATGLACLIVRGPSGALCGYVGVGVEHPLHGAGYDDVDVNCHGGLTFSHGCGHGEDESTGICHIPAPGAPDNVWWFGFDCAHAGDDTPGTRARLGREWWTCGVYRDWSYVESQVVELARQLATIEGKI